MWATITCDVWNSAYTDVLLNGSGPAYIDCTQTKPEDLAFMREGMISEGLTTLEDYMDRTGLDVSKHAEEFMQYEPHIIGRGLESTSTARPPFPASTPRATWWATSAPTSLARPCTAGLRAVTPGASATLR